MTKSYVVGWFAALFALGLITASASATEQTVSAPVEASTEAESDEQVQTGLPLFPLVEPEPTSEQPATDSADANDAPPVAMENLVEMVDEEAGPREFVIFIVRHMEKEDSTLDPGLTAEGVRRADALAQLLSNADIERIYSTLYRRSTGTVLPLARTLAIPVEFYQPDAGDALVATLLDAGQSALVVGHSNTVANLVNALGGSAEELSEDRYGDIFQLVIRVDGDDHDVRQVHLRAPLIAIERRGTR
ncbi:MAG: histidine phosphatase family protein [Idiomarina sp.]|nr:histidine phosphatase family protein [Idiomarina sp.]